ncbi:hypothetical protein [Raineya orbicola]|uniref:Uncharacterized protein n=1 Tax=Raineya orbicola TaxID=2016530 RepID=A0A2N3I9T7_9BACT|nr:hypothetical protein [Raineya orbicola]PKQ67076.1 hypothetical protein Rain11_2181 [Raineya orbicola]
MDYNIPQKSSFTSYGVFPVFLPEKILFTPEAAKVPEWFANLQANPNSLQEATIKNNILDELLLGNANSQFLQMGYGIKPRQEFLQNLQENVSRQNFIAKKIKQGFVPILGENFGGFQQVLSLIKRPSTPQPRLVVIEEYKTVSFLGNYGAGKTLKTFTMLPGEETTIAIRTYRESSSTQSRSENVVDSFSESSAKEMEKLLETENSSSSQDSTQKSKSANVGLSFPKIGLSGGTSASKSSQSVRQANTKSLNKALEKSVENSNSSRNVSVNTSSSITAKEGEEETITRRLKNVNQSCTLNVVFRQLLQEYITITYLDNIKVGFTNGHPEIDDIVPIEELDTLLKRYIEAKDIEEVRERLIFEYEKVMSSENGEKVFLAKIRKEDYDGNDASYYTKVKNLEDSYQVGENMTLKVAGVIQNVEKYTLRTDSLIADCVLGQGAALDCFSAKLQNSDSDKGILENEKTRIALQILESITDPVAKAEAFAKMFNPPKNV